MAQEVSAVIRETHNRNTSRINVISGALQHDADCETQPEMLSPKNSN
jgi:hypothetical protein